LVVEGGLVLGVGMIALAPAPSFAGMQGSWTGWLVVPVVLGLACMHRGRAAAGALWGALALGLGTWAVMGWAFVAWPGLPPAARIVAITDALGGGIATALPLPWGLAEGLAVSTVAAILAVAGAWVVPSRDERDTDPWAWLVAGAVLLGLVVVRKLIAPEALLLGAAVCSFVGSTGWIGSFYARSRQVAPG
jgi:hypothetical protein